MYSSNDLNNIINEQIAVLDKAWFKKKRASFEKSKNYMLEKDSICIVDLKIFPDYNQDGELVGEIEMENKYEFSFREYCSCYLPLTEFTCWGAFPDEYIDGKGPRIDASNNIIEIADRIVKLVSEFLQGETSTTIVHKFIAKVLEIIEREIKQQKNNIADADESEGVLDDLYNVCIQGFYKKFEKELTRYNETDGYLDTLEFDLNQSELLALLFLIQRAGFVRQTDNTPLLRFCSNHFLYKDPDGQPTKPIDIKALQKQYSKITTSQAPGSKQQLVVNGLTTVASRLDAIIKKLR